MEYRCRYSVKTSIFPLHFVKMNLSRNFAHMWKPAMSVSHFAWRLAELIR